MNSGSKIQQLGSDFTSNKATEKVNGRGGGVAPNEMRCVCLFKIFEILDKYDFIDWLVWKVSRVKYNTPGMNDKKPACKSVLIPKCVSWIF